MAPGLTQTTSPSWQRSVVNGNIKSSSHQKNVKVTESGPTWDDDILNLFKLPYWIPQDKRAKVGAGWIGAMQHYGAVMPDGLQLSLDKYEHVKYQAKTIYEHVISKSMPITNDPSELFPEEACELIRVWAANGFKRTKNDSSTQDAVIIPKIAAPVCRVRKDIRDLTDVEKRTFQSRLYDRLDPSSPNSKWQEWAEIHSWWCLHYQEATFFWHRAWLLYLENLIDFPIPYWNHFDLDAANPEHPASGMPQIFLDDEFKHTDGSKKRNPLKYARAYLGKSLDGTSEYVVRDPTLTASRPAKDSPGWANWTAKIAFLDKYNTQLKRAFEATKFSNAEGIGYPWYDGNVFGEDLPDENYQSQASFDGWFEQVHDNLHGWIGGVGDPATGKKGGDMTDNTYTAFDPIITVFHCNLDRMFNKYLSGHPTTQFSSNFPLQPFVNDNGLDINYTNPNRWAYTTLGDMAKNTQMLGYVFAPAAGRDSIETRMQGSFKQPRDSPGGKAISLHPIAMTAQHELFARAKAGEIRRTPLIIFEDVVCMPDSYTVDVFLNGAKSDEPDHTSNPDFVGRLFRLGMGRTPPGVPMKNSYRCSKPAVTRVLPVEDDVADRIAEGFYQIVRKVGDGKPIPAAEWKQMRGFQGKLIWQIDDE